MKKLKKILKDNNLTIAVAESLTSGKLQDQLCKQSGASSFYKGGITAYSIDSKVDILKINKEHAKGVNCVSEKVAKEMAKGASDLFKSDIGVATTGYADSDVVNGVHVPYAHVAIYFNGEYYTDRIIGKIEITRTFFRGYVIDKVMEVLPIFIDKITRKKKHNSYNKDFDSLSLIPGSSVVKLEGKLLNTEAKFIKEDLEVGYVFIDSYDELFTVKREDLNNSKIKFLRNE